MPAPYRPGAGPRSSAAARVLSLELAGLLAQLAVATLRSDGFRRLVDDAERAVGVAEARLTAGFGTPLDVDRLRIDLSRTEQVLRSAESDVSAALAACAALIAMPCEGFASSAEARRFLAGWIDDAALPDRPIEARPDLQALAAFERAARAEERLGRNTRIPDPTLRLGYLVEAGRRTLESKPKPADDGCSEELIKPRPLDLPQPQYTEAARSNTRSPSRSSSRCDASRGRATLVSPRARAPYGAVRRRAAPRGFGRNLRDLLSDHARRGGCSDAAPV